MLVEDDRIYVEFELISYIASRDTGRGDIAVQVGDPIFAMNLGYPKLPRDLVMQAVKLCIDNKWKNSPPLLVRLIDIIPEIMRQQRLKEIRERILLPPPPPDPALNPLNATILPSDVPFLNRVSLRTKLGQMASESSGKNQPILIITGGTKTGKTYSSFYIDHFSALTPNITTYRMVFDPEQGPEIGAKELAIDLVGLMGPPTSPVPEESTNLKRYVQELARWVLGEVIQSDPYHWFILDNFNGTELRQDTREFLIALADLITNGRFPSLCRLILIGFDRALLTVNPGKVDEEIISLATMNDAEGAITDVLRRYDINLPSTAVSNLLFTGMPNGGAFMQELNSGISSLIYACTQIKAIMASIPDAKPEALLEKIVGDLPFGPARRTELQTRLDNLRTSVARIGQQ